MALASRSQEPGYDIPYLDRPLLPLAVALPRILAKIAAELATAGPAEKWRPGQRAELIRGRLSRAATDTTRRD